MNVRQRRNLLIGVLAGVLVLALLGYRMFVAPLAELNKEYETAESEASLKNKEWAAFVLEKKKFQHFRLLGVPLSQTEGVSEYENYLRQTFEKTGLDRNDVDITPPKESDSRQTVVRKGQPNHLVRTFHVRVRNISWPRLLQFLAIFRETPFLHRIKNFNIEKPTGKSEAAVLNVVMAIDTLTVGGADPKAPKSGPQSRPDNLWGVDPRIIGLDALADLAHAPIGWAMILRVQGISIPKTPAGRDYALLSDRNPFYGPGFTITGAKAKEVAKNGRSDGKKNSEVLSEETVNVLKYLKFQRATTVRQGDDDKREAALRNWLKPLSSEDDIVLTRNKEFVIFNEAKEPVLKGKVLRLDVQDVYFQVGASVYCIHIGETLREAMFDEFRRRSKALSEDRLEELGLQQTAEPGDGDS